MDNDTIISHPISRSCLLVVTAFLLASITLVSDTARAQQNLEPMGVQPGFVTTVLMQKNPGDVTGENVRVIHKCDGRIVRQGPDDAAFRIRMTAHPDEHFARALHIVSTTRSAKGMLNFTFNGQRYTLPLTSGPDDEPTHLQLLTKDVLESLSSNGER